jgi:hypothetical protein
MLTSAYAAVSERESRELLVSYDILTALTERLDDLALFDASQVHNVC